MIHFSANQLNDFYILVALTLYGLVMIFCDRETDRQTERKKKEIYIGVFPSLTATATF